ncbi:MAG: isochorismatase family protein [Acidobacteria bacterium]|nr:isochorismatase family protein [Acidobacteriota bacterium]MBI3657552.1 isochorismatase family protein [Acidobacteriota bacterium]
MNDGNFFGPIIPTDNPLAGAPGAAHATERTESQALAQTRCAGKALSRSQCLLLLIDLQEKLLPAIFEKERVLQNSVRLLRMAGIMGIPIVLTTQYAPGLGRTVAEIAAEVPEIKPLDKRQFGCFGNADFCAHLGKVATARPVLLVAGIESHICVMQTVLGALDHGFSVHVAADAVSSRAAFNWNIGLERMKTAGAVISSSEMIIYELLAQSGTDEFKQMLPWLK